MKINANYKTKEFRIYVDSLREKEQVIGTLKYDMGVSDYQIRDNFRYGDTSGCVVVRGDLSKEDIKILKIYMSEAFDNDTNDLYSCNYDYLSDSTDFDFHTVSYCGVRVCLA